MTAVRASGSRGSGNDCELYSSYESPPHLNSLAVVCPLDCQRLHRGSVCSDDVTYDLSKPPKDGVYRYSDYVVPADGGISTYTVNDTKGDTKDYAQSCGESGFVHSLCVSGKTKIVTMEEQN